MNPYVSPEILEGHSPNRGAYDPSTLPLVVLAVLYIVLVAGAIFFSIK